MIQQISIDEVTSLDISEVIGKYITLFPDQFSDIL